MSNLSDFVASGSGGGPFTEVVHNTAYTFVLGDEENILHTSDNATPYTWTIPLNATTAFQIGSVLTIYNDGAGDITITADGAATLTAVGSVTDGDRAVSERGFATIVKVGTDDWVMNSDESITPTRAKLHYLANLGI